MVVHGRKVILGVVIVVFVVALVVDTFKVLAICLRRSSWSRRLLLSKVGIEIDGGALEDVIVVIVVVLIVVELDWVICLRRISRWRRLSPPSGSCPDGCISGFISAVVDIIVVVVFVVVGLVEAAVLRRWSMSFWRKLALLSIDSSVVTVSEYEVEGEIVVLICCTLFILILSSNSFLRSIYCVDFEDIGLGVVIISSFSGAINSLRSVIISLTENVLPPFASSFSLSFILITSWIDILDGGAPAGRNSGGRTRTLLLSSISSLARIELLCASPWPSFNSMVGCVVGIVVVFTVVVVVTVVVVLVVVVHQEVLGGQPSISRRKSPGPEALS